MKKRPLLSLSFVLLGMLPACAVLETSGAVSSGSESASKILDSISDSVKSISRSIDGSSESSSGGDDEKNEAFYRDVRALVAVCVRENLPSADLMREIGVLARSHGILDWQGLPGTVSAIGSGLRDGGLSESEYGRLRQRLQQGARTLALLDRGYGYR